MDKPQVYGPVAHTLTFAKAARRDIICGYKVIISAVSSDMVNEYLLRRHGEVLIEGDPVKARQVAHQIAIQKSVEELFGVSKIFTFHRSVASAKSFVATESEGIVDGHRTPRPHSGPHRPRCWVWGINGVVAGVVYSQSAPSSESCQPCLCVRRSSRPGIPESANRPPIGIFIIKCDKPYRL